MNDQIYDLQNVKDILYSTDEATYDNDVMIDIKSRHNDSFRSWNITNTTHKMIQKWKHIIRQVNINNKRWIKQIHFETQNKNSNYNWLCADEMRNNSIDSLKVNQHTVDLLTYIGGYLNRIIGSKLFDQNRELIVLYIPIITCDSYSPIFCILINILSQEYN